MPEVRAVGRLLETLSPGLWETKDNALFNRAGKRGGGLGGLTRCSPPHSH